jgi:hypothetical protein
MFFRVPAPHASNWVWHTGEGLQCPQPLQVPRYMIHTLHPLALAPLYLSSLPLSSPELFRLIVQRIHLVITVHTARVQTSNFKF